MRKQRTFLFLECLCAEKRLGFAKTGSGQRHTEGKLNKMTRRFRRARAISRIFESLEAQARRYIHDYLPGVSPHCAAFLPLTALKRGDHRRNPHDALPTLPLDTGTPRGNSNKEELGGILLCYFPLAVACRRSRAGGGSGWRRRWWCGADARLFYWALLRVDRHQLAGRCFLAPTGCRTALLHLSTTTNH